MYKLDVGSLLICAYVIASLSLAPVRADEPLPKSRAEAIAMETKDALPATRFYDPPQPLPAASPEP